MQKQYVIDIGSNSVRLLAAWVGNGQIETIQKWICTTRIGQGVNKTKLLSQEAMDRTLLAIGEYVEIANEYPVYIFATSAVRDAKNRDVFLGEVKKRFGLDVALLSGQQEAACGLEGALLGLDIGGMIDIGGGSTEVAVRKSGEASFSHSFNVGCVRGLEKFPEENFEATYAWTKAEFEKYAIPMDVLYFGIGGTPTALAAIDLDLEIYDPLLVDQHILTRQALEELLHKLLPKSILERSRKYHMEEKRAEVIIYGIAILMAFMDVCSLAQIKAREADNLEGYLSLKQKGAI